MKGTLISGIAGIMATVVLQGASIPAAKAASVEFFKCSLAEGATMDGLVAATKALLVTAKENGIENYSVRYLSPLYSSDIARGKHYWVGIAPNAADMGAFNDYWDTEANKAHREAYRALVTDCESSSLYYSTQVELDE